MALAKLAIQIQAKKSPEFDKIFVILGSFHIEIAYFNSCEKIISESDALQTLDESLVLAAGSSNVFTKVKTTTDVKEYMNDSY